MTDHAFNHYGSPRSPRILTVGNEELDGVAYVCLELATVNTAHLTPDQARAVAADLIANADALDETGRSDD